MSDLITRTARLVPYSKRPKQVPSFVTAYSYEPLADEPGFSLGNMYVVLEVLISGRGSEEAADLIIETIGTHYYNKPLPDTEALKRFESAIKAVNQELVDHVNRGNAAWIGKLSATIAIQVGNEIHLAQTGSAEAILYRDQATTRIKAAPSPGPTTPSKTFASIASGELEPGDRLLLSTPALIHQVPLTRLQSIISQSSPNTAISEITRLLQGTSTERIAALIIETTTPELAALQVRSEQPDEIHLGAPETPLEAAKMVTAPLAQSTIASSQKVAKAATNSWQRAQPRLHSLRMRLFTIIRTALSTSKGRWILIISLALISICIITLMFFQHRSNQSTQQFTQVQHIYSQIQQAHDLAQQSKKTEARTLLTNSQKQLSALMPHQSTIDQYLQKTALPSGQPLSLKELDTLITERIDELDGLIKVDPVSIAGLPGKNAKLRHFEIYSGRAYAFDATNANTLSIIDLASGTIRASNAKTTNLDEIIATTLSANNDGLYILTKKPSVWFYKFDTDTLTAQTINFGSWPNATAIASYGSNLYLLEGSTIYKHVKTSTGFSPKSSYINLGTAGVKDATTIAVDGYIYVVGSNSIYRFLAGSIQQTANLPTGLSTPQSLRSLAGGTILVSTSSDSNRIGLWKANENQFAFSKQFSLNHAQTAYNATYDAKTNTVYAAIEGRLIKFVAP